MTSIKSSPDVLSQASAGLSESLLASLTSALNANDVGDTAFSNLLEQVDANNQSNASKVAAQNMNSGSSDDSNSQQEAQATDESDTTNSPSTYVSTNVSSYPNSQNASSSKPQSQQGSTPQTTTTQSTSAASSSSSSSDSSGTTSSASAATTSTSASTTSTSSTDDTGTTSKKDKGSDTTATTPTDAQTAAAAMVGMIPPLAKKTVVVADTSDASAGTRSTSAAGTTSSAGNAGVSGDRGSQKADTKDSPTAAQQAKASTAGTNASPANPAANDLAAEVGDGVTSGTIAGSTTAASATDKLASILTPAASTDQEALASQTDFTDFLTMSFAGQGAAAFLPPSSGVNGQVAAASGQGGSFNLDNGQQSGGNAAALGSGSNTSASSASELASTSTSSSASAKASSPYSFASQLTATRTSTATGMATAVDQVALQLNRSAKDGNDQMTLQLHPADLGRVSIKLDITSDGKVTGTVTADSRATLDLLSKDSRSLERSLQDAGLQADSGSLQFNMSGQSGHSFGQTAQHAASNTPAAGSGFVETTGEGSAVPVAETYYLTPGGVNLSV